MSNHVVDLVNKYPREELPPALTGYITDRTGYDYLHHAEVGSRNAGFVGDEVTDRFCILGEVDEHIAKLRELADAGVDQFNLYLMNGDEEDQARGLRARHHPVAARLVGTGSQGQPAHSWGTHRLTGNDLGLTIRSAAVDAASSWRTLLAVGRPRDWAWTAIPFVVVAWDVAREPTAGPGHGPPRTFSCRSGSLATGPTT